MEKHLYFQDEKGHWHHSMRYCHCMLPSEKFKIKGLEYEYEWK